MKQKKSKYDLQDRLIDYSVSILDFTKTITGTYAGSHLSGQLIRSGTSVALNYGEAQSAESRKDFIHKMRISLKELRESLVCLKIIQKAKLYKSDKLLETVLKESDELISIFVKSIETAQRKI